MNEPPPGPRTTERLPFPLQEGETVLSVCRRHWIYLWPRIAVLLLVTLIPPTVVALLLSAADAYEGVVAQVFWVASLVYIVFWGLRIFLTWYRYRHDIWVITNQRLIDSYKRHPFSLRVATADLVNVQDITVERDGVLRTLLDYGDIVCQTAAELHAFRLTGILDPRETQALVDRERDRERMRGR